MYNCARKQLFKKNIQSFAKNIKNHKHKDTKHITLIFLGQTFGISLEKKHDRKYF